MSPSQVALTGVKTGDDSAEGKQSPTKLPKPRDLGNVTSVPHDSGIGDAILPPGSKQSSHRKPQDFSQTMKPSSR